MITIYAHDPLHFRYLLVFIRHVQAPSLGDPRYFQ